MLERTILKPCENTMLCFCAQLARMHACIFSVFAILTFESLWSQKDELKLPPKGVFLYRLLSFFFSLFLGLGLSIFISRLHFPVVEFASMHTHQKRLITSEEIVYPLSINLVDDIFVSLSIRKKENRNTPSIPMNLRGRTEIRAP